MMPMLRVASVVQIFIPLVILILTRQVQSAECWTTPVSSSCQPPPPPRLLAYDLGLIHGRSRGRFRNPPAFDSEVTKHLQSSQRWFSSSSRRYSLLRGGGASSPIGIVGLARKLAAYVGASRTRCLIVLFMSILGESVSTSLNKYAKVHGSIPALIAACCLYLCTVMGFNLCLAKIEVGIAYAIWSAMGTLIISCVGIIFFGESCDVAKLTCLLLIVTGVVGLNLRSS